MNILSFKHALILNSLEKEKDDPHIMITFTSSLAWFSVSAAASTPTLGVAASSGVTRVAVVGLE